MSTVRDVWPDIPGWRGRRENTRASRLSHVEPARVAEVMLCFRTLWTREGKVGAMRPSRATRQPQPSRRHAQPGRPLSRRVSQVLRSLEADRFPIGGLASWGGSSSPGGIRLRGDPSRTRSLPPTTMILEPKHRLGKQRLGARNADHGGANLLPRGSASRGAPLTLDSSRIRPRLRAPEHGGDGPSPAYTPPRDGLVVLWRGRPLVMIALVRDHLLRGSLRRVPWVVEFPPLTVAQVSPFS